MSSLKHDLFAGSFIRPGEQRDYNELRAELHRRFAPADVLEQSLVDEVHRAMWRLRRCARIEAELSPVFVGDTAIHDPMEAIGEVSERIQIAVDRPRAQAHRILHRCTAELRKLQSGRDAQSSEPEETQRPEAAPRPEITKQSQFDPPTARNAECPCGSGEKYKRCCGKGAPPLLFAA
ncbi:MAG TPA: SEC-C metal-binding domain-containing protein [Bryobacteraceae bacterium]|nr:SEC-C metal-binding domain-containing protein [Bryobacteraceae bacterium]